MTPHAFLRQPRPGRLPRRDALPHQSRAGVDAGITVTTLRVRPGFARAFLDARKAVKAAHEKAGVDEHWAFYEVASGAPMGTYMMLFGSSTMKDEDTDPHTQAYRDAVGDEGREMLQKMQREAVMSADTPVFAIIPQMSHVPDEWIKARPDFWKAPAMKAAMAKPAPAARP